MRSRPVAQHQSAECSIASCVVLATPWLASVRGQRRRTRVIGSSDAHCLKGVVYFGKQRTLPRTNKTIGKYIFRENVLHQLWSDSYPECLVLSAAFLHGNGVIHRTQKVIQGDDNGHVGRPGEVSLAPPYPELFASYGASGVTRTSGRGHVGLRHCC